MLGSKKSAVSVSGKTTLISRDTVIVGDLRFSGVVEVEGLVQGNLVAEPGKEALVRIVEKGRVEGEIRSPAVIINGEVEGNVHASRHLELAAKARVKGSVFYSMVEMAAGAEVNGSMTHVAEPGEMPVEEVQSAEARPEQAAAALVQQAANLD